MGKEFSITVVYKEEKVVITGQEDKTILAALRDADIAEPESPCGGAGTCGKCTAAVTGMITGKDFSGLQEVSGKILKLCTVFPAGDCTVFLSSQDEINVLTDGTGEIDAGGDGLGFAVDIGTTTVAAYLYDLGTGRQLATCGSKNSQGVFGADVIARITNCANDGLRKMQELICGQLKEMAVRLCNETGHNIREITRASIAGNTVMQHLFYGLDPTSIGVTPFTPLSWFGRTEDYPLFTDVFADGCELWIAPAVAGYVGGDITAGFAACMDDFGDGQVLYIDIGTNGEMLIGSPGKYVSCATAAGPAFEGALIDCGTPAKSGAVDKVKAENGELYVHTIDDAPAVGVCGSGLIDAVASLIELEVITGAGRLLPPEEAPEKFRDRIRKREDGVYCFYLSGSVYISASDVRKLQLAKASIRAGAETLMQITGKTPEDIDRLVIAGGFGSHMSVPNALYIGLLPEIPAEKIKHVGNAAGAGAAMALADSGRDKINAFTKECGYLELSGSDDFMDNYIEYMPFIPEDE